MRATTLSMCALSALVVASACGPRVSSEWVEMRDGTRLATEVYLPEGDGPFPTVLIRTPYGREDVAVVAPALNDAGLAVVAQDLRGRFDSEGIDGVFTTDGDGALKDGWDTMAWVVDQRWSNGLIGTMGDSADGIVQYVQAAADPPGLAVMQAGVATPSLYTDGVFQGGVYRHALTHLWLEEQGSLHFEDEIAAHPFEDAFWDSTQTRDQYDRVHAAGFHLGGWFDIFQAGTIEAFTGYQHHGGEGAAGAQKLVMGPWVHAGSWSREQGELVFPASAAESPSDNVFDVLFNYHLNLQHPDIQSVPDDIPNVQYYVMGDVDDASAPGNVWRSADDWPPPAAPIRLHLQPGGGLREACPDSSSPTPYRFDPADPSPTVCGHNLNIANGPCDQRAVEARDDVVTFSTEVLAEPMEITGRLEAHLFVDIDQPDADLIVKLTDVYPDGRSMLMAEGALRLATRGSTTGLTPLTDGEIVEGIVDLWNLSLIVNAGHRLRISITSSSWPRFAVNRNNGMPYPRSVTGDGVPVNVRIHHGAEHASYLEVPDPTRSAGEVVACDP